MVKKKIIINSFIVLFLLSFFNCQTALADSLSDTFNKSLDKTAQGTGHLELEVSKKSPSEIASFIIKITLSFLGVIFLILMMYGGFKWMLSAGNDQAVGEAKKILKNGFIGLLIVAAAYGVTAFIGSVLSSATVK